MCTETAVSARIWGRLIDFDIQLGDHRTARHYSQERGEWMEEVLKRAGSAPLWISGEVLSGEIMNQFSFYKFDSMLFFIRLLESQWERIEIISVGIPGMLKLPDALQTGFFNSRAPILKHFEIPWLDWSDDEPNFQCSPSRKLFANYAPSLRIMNAACIPFSIDSPWLSGIREMVPIPFGLTISEIITLLQQMPLLQKFQLAHCFPDPTAPQPTLHLPNLTSLIMATCLSSAARILECLSKARLSSLDIELYKHRDMDVNHDILSVFKNSMSQYIFDYFASNLSTNIRLNIGERSFACEDISKQSGSTQSQNLNVQLECCLPMSPEDGRDVIMSVLDAIPLASTLPGGNPDEGLYDSIDEIKLDLCYEPRTLFPNLRSVFAVFQRVKLICIEDYSLENFLDVCFPDQPEAGGDDDYCDVMFPELHVLCVSSVPHRFVDADPTRLIDFLLERKRIGYPVHKLYLNHHLTKFERSDSIPDFARLEEVDGLEVVWKQSPPESRDEVGWDVWSYVCGSGDSERLIAFESTY